MEYSISPDGEKFKIPDEEDYKKEYVKGDVLKYLKKISNRSIWYTVRCDIV